MIEHERDSFQSEPNEIFIDLPEPNALSDEDSGDEYTNVTKQNLVASAEIRLNNNIRVRSARTKKKKKIILRSSKKVASKVKRTTINIAKSKRNKKRSLLSTSRAKGLAKVKISEAKKNALKNEWINGDFEKTTTFPSSNYKRFRKKSPVELFEMMFDNEIFDLLLNETRKYASFCNKPDPNITEEELKVFIGVLLLSGYNRKPGKKFLWDSEKDMGNEMVIQSMRRDRFIEIMKFMHCADNNEINQNDKMWKLRPLVDKLKANFLKYFIPTEHINFDESMVKYFGKHSCKQFIRGKPIRFGYKVWCLNADNGYLIQFDIYQGSGTTTNEIYELKFGKAATPLVTMLDDLPENVKNLPYQIYIDNLFTGLPLLTYLKQRGYGATGTMRVNRVPSDCPMTDKKKFKKFERGHIESTIAKDSGVMLVRWNDNAVVTMASTSYGVNPLASVKRYSKSEKKLVNVNQPCAIKSYNAHMGGTDRMDEDISRHRIGIHGKKWYWPLLTWLIDAAVNNAWVLYKSSGRPTTNLNFRRHIVQTYLKRYGTPPKGAGRKAISKHSASRKRVSDDIRYDKLEHYVMEVPNKKRKRCAGEKCDSVVRTQCEKCELGMCIRCFKKFHTNKKLKKKRELNNDN